MNLWREHDERITNQQITNHELNETNQFDE